MNPRVSTPFSDPSGERASDHCDALLIGYEGQENLGLRHLVSFLRIHGLRSLILELNPGSYPEIIEVARTVRPRLIGFSLIFQMYAPEFADLAGKLCAAGIKSHFTVGGHFPSLRPRETLLLMTAVDSVVRFEGEYTLLELLRNLETPELWPNIRGLAFRNGDGVVLTPLRPLIPDLDTLPPAERDQFRELPRGVRAASLIASRGCCYDCSFCSIRQFYGTPPGALRRTRSARSVAEEMEHLHRDRRVRFFLFMDDDFAFRGRRQREWVTSFLRELDERGLASRIGWKISCRTDDVKFETMAECRDRGLSTVYLGVESGNPQGLDTLTSEPPCKPTWRRPRQ